MVTVETEAHVLEQHQVAELYRRYAGELERVLRLLRRQFHAMERQGDKIAFGDVEGELLYMLLRERAPDVVFEIAAAAGWSTNYVLAALTANGKGVLHSFELMPRLGNRPTEAVIRANQSRAWDQQRLMVHIGDARHTVPQVRGTIDFVLLDGCHEDWFARWYIDTIFPRVDGFVLIQDVAFTDQLEPAADRPSSEASYVWSWLDRHQVPVTLLGAVEAALEPMAIRTGYPERKPVRSNAVLFSLPQTHHADLPGLAGSPEDMMKEAQRAIEAGKDLEADRLLNAVVSTLQCAVTRVNRHRLLFEAGLGYGRIGERGERQRCFQRALGMVVQEELFRRPQHLVELLEFFWRHRQWRLMAQTGTLMCFEPRTWPMVVERLRTVLQGRFSRVR